MTSPICRVLALWIALSTFFWSPATWADPKQTAVKFLSSTTREARRTLINQPGSGKVLRALGTVLERGVISESLLRRVVSNPHAQPYLTNTINALPKVDRVPGVKSVLGRMARARDASGVSGAEFEVVAGAALRRQLKSLSSMVNGEEVDALLKNGTVVEMKAFSSRWAKKSLAKAQKQLIRRSQGTKPTMLLINHKPDAKQKKIIKRMARAIRTGLIVVAVDERTGASKKVFSKGPSQKRWRPWMSLNQPSRAAFSSKYARTKWRGQNPRDNSRFKYLRQARPRAPRR